MNICWPHIDIGINYSACSIWEFKSSMKNSTKLYYVSDILGFHYFVFNYSQRLFTSCTCMGFWRSREPTPETIEDYNKTCFSPFSFGTVCLWGGLKNPFLCLKLRSIHCGSELFGLGNTGCQEMPFMSSVARPSLVTLKRYS